MFKVYLSNYEGNQVHHLNDFNTRGEALNYIIETLELDGPAYKIVFTKSNEYIKVYSVEETCFAKYIIKGDN